MKGLKKMKVVIIGGGTAGVSAATHLRRKNEKAEIIIIEKSSEFAVAACGLPSLLSGKIKDKDDIIGATVLQMKYIFNVEVKLNTEVLTIDKLEHELNLSTGEKLSYDKLIIAAGSLQLRPDIVGILGDNIFTMHNIYSTQRIIDYFWGLNAKRVVILGGGKVGLAVAEALLAHNAKITIIDKASHILSALDYDFASIVKQKLEQPNLTIITNTTVKEFLPDKAILSNGTKLKYDMAIVAAGSKSEMRLPIMADIDIGETGGIIVDEHMQTSMKDIYACGDNAELKDIVSNLPFRLDDAAFAVRGAKIAADNATEIDMRLGGALRNQAWEFMGYVIGITGCNEDDLNRAGIAYHKLYFTQDNSEAYGGQPQPMYMKLLFGIDGKILGFQIIGKKCTYARLNVVAAIIKQRGNVQDLSEMPMAYFPSLTKARDGINHMGSLAVEMVSERLKTISIDDLDEEDILLNVCAAENFKQNDKHLAINIPLANLRQSLSKIPKNNKIAITCNGGYAAYLAYCILVQSGFNQVFWVNSADIWQ